VVEALIAEDPGLDDGKIFDVIMLVVIGGIGPHQPRARRCHYRRRSVPAAYFL
jgi:hypothetical protein